MVDEARLRLAALRKRGRRRERSGRKAIEQRAPEFLDLLVVGERGVGSKDDLAEKRAVTPRRCLLRCL
jgi:hypothetical protein